MADSTSLAGARGLVLGATGFIGGGIARAAHEAGMTVRGLRRRVRATGAVGDLPIDWRDGDLGDVDSLRGAMAGCDVVFHAAGYAPHTERDVSRALRRGVAGMRAVLSAAVDAGIGRIVYTSSLSTIGSPPPGADRLADERDGYLPGSTGNPYYEVKWAMEHEALRAARYGLPVVILCPTAVFGPGDVKPSTGRILLELIKGRMPASVDMTLNVVDGRDVALAHVRAASLGAPGERYIIGGHNLAIPEAFRQAAEIAGVRPPWITLGLPTVRALLTVGDALRLPITATMRAMPHWQPLDASKARRAFGVEPRPFAETVRDTAAWFRAHGYV